jgi:hypothetical protein
LNFKSCTCVKLRWLRNHTYCWSTCITSSTDFPLYLPVGSVCGSNTLAISQVIFYLKDIDTKIHKQRAWSKRRTGARMLAGPASEPVRARVLRVLRDGAATSLVAQMLHSNAVLKCAVGGWRQAGQAEGAAAATNGSKPNEQNKPNLHELMARLKKGEHVPLFSKPKTFIFDSQPNLREI